MSEKPKTICVNCKWHRRSGPVEVWYNNKCSHPATLLRRMDYTTGQVVIEETYCRSVNTDGQCKHYEPSVTLLEVARSLLGRQQ